MTTFQIHNQQTAPEASKPFLDRAKKQYGMVPNLIGLLAEAPVAVEAYQTLAGLFTQSSLTPTERNIVWLTNNYENECEYCMAAHTGIAKSEKVDDAIIEALRNGEPLADQRLQALRQFTTALIVNRGWVGVDEVDTFLAAGYTKQNVLELIVGIAHKVISNYANHLADTPVDAPFQKFAWDKATTATV